MEAGIALRVGPDEIEKIPLRHKGDEFAVRGQMGEIGDGGGLVADCGRSFAHFLMRPLQKFLEQPEFVHEVERGRVNGVAAEVAKEIGVLFQHDGIDAGSRSRKPSIMPAGPPPAMQQRVSS